VRSVTYTQSRDQLQGGNNADVHCREMGGATLGTVATAAANSVGHLPIDATERATVKVPATAGMSKVGHQTVCERDTPHQPPSNPPNIKIVYGDDGKIKSISGNPLDLEKANVFLAVDKQENPSTPASKPTTIDFKELLINMNTQWIDPSDKEIEAVADSILDKDVVMIDSGANVSVARDWSVLDPDGYEQTARHTAEVKGINKGSLQIDGIGEFADPDLRHFDVLYSSNAQGNIAALCDIKKNYWVQFRDQDTTRDRLECTHKRTGKQISFNINAEKLYVRNKPKQNQSYAMPIKLDGKLQKLGLSKECIIRAMRIDKIHRSTSYLSLQNLYQLIKNHGIIDCDLVAQDVLNYQKYIHKEVCRGCTLGKTVQEPAIIEHPKPNFGIGDEVHVDYMYITSEGKLTRTHQFMVAVDGYSNYIVLLPTEDRKKSTFLKNVDLLVAEYKLYGHTIKRLRLDGEGAFTASEEELKQRNIIPTYCTVKRHVRKAESAIKQIKSMFRATLFGLDFSCPTLLYPRIIDYVVSSINYSYKD
jgi:hypothetical protein